jgi:4-amino-4-deoxy-L-arabinose transferase-like glycosyltransferase
MPDAKSLALSLVAASFYLVAQGDGLSRVPPIGDDEVWIASSAHKLATEGIPGSDLMKGFFGGERHTYHHMPLYSHILAVVFRCGGTSAVTMRLLPTLCGLLVLLMVQALGRRLGGPGLGGLALLLMLLLRVSADEGRTGVPLLDVARTGRYDVMVPVFGLAALLAIPSRDDRGAFRWLGVGVLVGLSALTHAYGAFLLVALLALMVWGRDQPLRPRASALVAGFLLPMLPWLWFVASGWSDFQGQMAIPAGRFDLLQPSFYLENLLHEAERYRAMTGPVVGALQRPGVWTVLFVGPAALFWLIRSGRKGEHHALREIAALLAIQGLLFATLLRSKNPAYAMALWPLVVLLVAFALLRVWNTRPEAWVRAAVAALLVGLAGDGLAGSWQRHAATAGVTPYDVFEARLRETVPRGARVLGLPRFWLGLQETDYRTWAVPFDRARSPGSGVTLGQALAAIDPEIVLMDPDMEKALAERAPVEHPYHSELVEIQAFFAARGATVLTVLKDPTYGPVTVYRLEPVSAANYSVPARMIPESSPMNGLPLGAVGMATIRKPSASTVKSKL